MMGAPGSTLNPVHLVLVGSMAAGKSTVGRALAKRRSAAFVDTDDEVERMAGVSIAHLFATQGERAFRALERAACLEALDATAPSVVAFGGGAFEDPVVRARCEASDVHTTWLRVSPAVALSRAAADGLSRRPLLDLDDPAGRLAGLIEDRSARWASADLVVDADHASKDEIVDWIVRAIDG